ncbi:c-type cytochrome [Vitiosangium sp. GDMCC 1.1324]|uniref:c-type cytochrome n=1 Tax=Vitiosangium sp. (strain GDMCC 1.1324) TaxID=2138576 RepID=UPI001E4871BF|nr:cytochrome C [Vitiosangium sp. GDMCC 1.1324]
MNARKSLGIAALAALGLLSLGSAPVKKDAPPPQHQVPKSADGDVVIALCDGETTLEVEGVKDPAKIDRNQAQEISNQLMLQWRKKNPDARWDGPVTVAQAQPPSPPPAAKAPGSNKGPSAASGADQVQQKQDANVQAGHTYGAFSARDEALWKASTEQIVQEGHRVFHDAKELGGTVAVSCDMCHPDASNTHPETYPKYQVQLGRVALLRDMINWCIENPVRGKPLAEDDPRMKAMEAYIYAQRKGVKLEYGKH